MMKLFIQNASTDKVELNRWLVLNSDGGIFGVFLGDICGSEGLTLLCANGMTFTNAQPELSLLEAQRGLIARALGTQGFELVIRPYWIR